MKSILCLLVSLFITILPNANANEVDFDYNTFAKQYFDTWVKTQLPTATKEDLENYLSLLTADVAWQHIPYQPDDERRPSGKQDLRKGMTRWLAANTEYKAELIDVLFGDDVIILKLSAQAKFADSEGELVSRERNYVDVLELDKGKVSIIRRYGK